MGGGTVESVAKPRVKRADFYISLTKKPPDRSKSFTAAALDFPHEKDRGRRRIQAHAGVHDRG